MKRNKRTEVVADEELMPLTEKILTQMGPRGAVIRRRLQRFYQERSLRDDPPGEGEQGRSV